MHRFGGAKRDSMSRGVHSWGVKEGNHDANGRNEDDDARNEEEELLKEGVMGEGRGSKYGRRGRKNG